MKNSTLFHYSLLLIGLSIFVLQGCKKGFFEPSIYGTWEEINNTQDQTATGCELIVEKSAEEVSLCGFKFVHPRNVVTMTTRGKAKLFVDDGQMFYRQKTADVLWIAPIASTDHYFLDYDFDGKFLWIIGDDTDNKVIAKGAGKVFRKK